MQNSFEKQVQQKMDELKFVPTEPVWQNIEKQIRTKKDRWRFVLWLPLLCLLLGSGVWWLTSHNQKSKSAIATEQKTTFREKQNASPVQNNLTKTTEGKDASVTTIQAEEKAKPVEATAIQTTVSSVHSPTPLKAKNRKAVSGNIPSPITAVEKPTAEVLASNTEENIETTTLQHKTSVTPVQTKTEALIQPDTAETDSSTQNKTAAIQSNIHKDSLQAQAAQAVDIKESGASKWNFGFIMNAGISGIAKGFGSVSLNQFFDASPNYSTSPGSTPQLSHRPSPVKNNVAFSAGATVNKKLNKQFSFSTGLKYSYYSTTRMVGTLRTQDSTLNANKSVSRFFLNTGTSFTDYHNHYHFIAIPASIEWKFFPKIPLQLHAGLSFQYLIGSNALIFDARNNLYYTDKDALQKTQLFSDFSFSYAIITKKKSSLLLGPQLQYGLSSLEKNTSRKHLFSLGLTAQFLFQKN